MINSFLKQTAGYAHSARSKYISTSPAVRRKAVYIKYYVQKNQRSDLSASQYEISLLKIPSGISHHRRCEESLSYVQ